MYGFILGFQRRVWCPKCTPASSSSRMVTTDMRGPLWLPFACRPWPANISRSHKTPGVRAGRSRQNRPEGGREIIAREAGRVQPSGAGGRPLLASGYAFDVLQQLAGRLGDRVLGRVQDEVRAGRGLIRS